jgi:DNA repair photolyase
MVKENAPELLEAELASPKWKPQTLVMSGVTDPYQPIEKKLQITRRCLQVLAKFRNPIGMLTKNRLITRDIDIFRELAAHNAVALNISVTTLDPKLQRILEPRTSPPQARLDAVAQLRDAGIPVGVMVAPIIPGITDHEVPAIVAACGKAGAQFAGYVMLRLPWAVAPIFERWLDEHFPGHKEKVLGRVRHMRGGKALRFPLVEAAGRRGDLRGTSRRHVRSRLSPSRHRRTPEALHRRVPAAGRAAGIALETGRGPLSGECHAALLPHHQQHANAPAQREDHHQRVPRAPAIGAEESPENEQTQRRPVILNESITPAAKPAIFLPPISIGAAAPTIECVEFTVSETGQETSRR